MVTVTTKRARAYARRFDHDECRRLYATGGWTQSRLAARFGVSQARIGQIVNPSLKARVDARSRERFAALCDDCGGPCTHNWWNKNGRHDRVICRTCSMERKREERLLGRLNEAGDIRCHACGNHKPIEAYRLRPATGYPCNYCRACETAKRMEYPDKRRGSA